MAICRAGKALNVSQCGAMMTTQQKPVASRSLPHTTTDAVSLTELQVEHVATQGSGCLVCPTLTPVQDGST